MKGLPTYITIESRITSNTITNVYATTEMATKIEKEEFYNKRKKENEKIPRYDTLIVSTDDNVKIWKEEQELYIKAGRK